MMIRTRSAEGRNRTPTPRLGRALATYLLLPFVSVALTLLLFETGLRIAGYEAIYEIYSKPWIFWRHDELLGWSHEPGASDYYVGPRPWPIEFRAFVSINSIGLRGPEVPAKHPGELRVLALGDSMVAAFEVEYAETFGARLESALAERLHRPVRVINAGVRGYGTDQSLLYFRERGWQLEPDAVLLFYSGNDPVDNTTLHEMRRPFGKGAFALDPDGTLRLMGVPVPRFPTCSEYVVLPTSEVARVDTVFNRLLCRVQLVLFDRSALFSLVTISIPWDASVLQRLYYLGNPQADLLARTDGNDPALRYSLDLTTATILEIASESKRRGADFLMTGGPTQLEPLDLDLLNRNGIDVVSLAQVLAAPRHEVTWHHDSHFNPEGHRRVSLLLLDAIERKLRKADRGR